MLFSDLPWPILTDLLATSVEVERTFSKGRQLLSYQRSRLSSKSTRAVMCLGEWSKLGYVEDKDISSVVQLPDVEGHITLEL